MSGTTVKLKSQLSNDSAGWVARLKLCNDAYTVRIRTLPFGHLEVVIGIKGSKLCLRQGRGCVLNNAIQDLSCGQLTIVQDLERIAMLVSP